MQSTVQGAIKYRFDFLKYRYLWLGISIAYLFIGVAAYMMQGGFRYHIDFTGGAQVQIKFDKPMDIGSVRSAIGKKWSDSVIQSVGTTGQEFLIVVGEMSSDTEAKITQEINQAFPENKSTISNIQWVGAEAGKETTANAIYAVLLSLLILLAYIAIRFEFRFGVGAVVSLIHDVLAVMFFILLVREPISLHVLASILAVLGYSMNDTIVIFARIRENMKKHHGASEYDIANLSINQTLKRTLLTSFATGLSVLAILVLGGENLRGLSLVLLIGIIVGTYSSIYIASPMMLAIKSKKKA